MLTKALMGLMWMFGAWLHPFFVSVIDLRHNAAEQSIEVSVKAFTDDFENALRQNFPGAKIDLMKTGNEVLEDSLINVYLRKKIQILVNGKSVALQYIGHERQEESVWSYYEIRDVPVVNSVQVHTQLLYEYKKEQINIIHARVENNQRSYRLSHPETIANIVF